MRNIYDNSEFFAAYAEMGRSKDGLKAAGEWHQLQLMPLSSSFQTIFASSHFRICGKKFTIIVNISH